MTDDQGLDRADASDGRPDPELALAVLFRRHYAELLRLACCLLRDLPEAEDVVQEAFLALQRNERRLRDASAAHAYLRSTVLNLSRSHLRRIIRGRRNRTEAGSPPVDPADHALAHDEQQRIWAAIQHLPTRQREVLICRYYLELDEAGIAAALQISTGSVKRHAHRATSALRARLGVTA